MKDNEKTVLQKFLSMSGLGSRRSCENLIRHGSVTVNGKLAELGAKVRPEKDDVKVNGKTVEFSSAANRYIMLNKPRGYVTTMKDERNRKCVADLIKDIPGRLFPVGRLDKDSEGLLIMTNDGDFANKIAHPSHNIWKTYRATVRPKITENQIITLCTGVMIDGKMTAIAQVKVIREEADKSVLEISVQEGRNRQIRKMCESVGLEVARLKRSAVGYLKLGMLPLGKWRNLKEEEIKSLIK